MHVLLEYSEYKSDFMWIIGERINPTGKPDLISALTQKDRTFIQAEVRRQEDAGAQALDINVGVPKIDRIDAMRFVVQSARDVTALPLVIDEQDPEAIEAALDYIGNGAWINAPVDSEKDSERFAELANMFGAQMIILPLAGGRLTESVSEHVETANQILKRFEDLGIAKERVIIDAMLFSVNQAKEKVMDTLERIKRLKSDLGVRTAIGLSNISFGLENREALNAGFLRLAQAAGLDAVICDPLQKQVMEIANGSGEENSGENQKSFLKLAETCLTG
jgi:5-methyltetrahydrofolate--homocysteine methyltransferase